MPDALSVVTFVELRGPSAAEGAMLLRQYRDGARRAEGSIEAEAAQEIGRPNRFVLIEGWRGASEFDAHRTSDAARRLRDALGALASCPADERRNLGFDTAAAQGAGALVVVTHVDVAPPGRAATEAALVAAAAATRREPGNLRCDVLQQLAPRLNHFNLVAAWRARSDFERHEAAAHRVQFRATLAPLLGALYDERLYEPL